MQSFFKKIPKQTYTVIKKQFIGPKYKGKNLRTHKIASCIAIQKSVKKVWKQKVPKKWIYQNVSKMEKNTEKRSYDI